MTESSKRDPDTGPAREHDRGLRRPRRVSIRKALMLVRIAALVAVDAPPVSYLLNLEAASEMGLDAERVRGVLAAIAPIVGTARVASATAKILDALEIAVEIVELEEEEESQS